MDSNRVGVEQEPVFELVRGISRDISTIMSKELTAAKIEVRQALAAALSAGIYFGTGGFVLAMSGVLLSLMLMFGLSAFSAMPLWASAGIFGAIYGVAGSVLLLTGKNKAAAIIEMPKARQPKTSSRI